MPIGSVRILLHSLDELIVSAQKKNVTRMRLVVRPLKAAKRSQITFWFIEEFSGFLAWGRFRISQAVAATKKGHGTGEP
jgi:hypothetical protein